MRSPLIFVRDDRTLPFIPVTTEALALIDENERPNRRAYVRSLYLALLQCANETRTDRAEVTRKKLGRMAGMSPDLVSDLARTLEACGLVRVVARFHDNQRLENEWVLTEPTPLATTGHPLGHEPPPLPVAATAKALEGGEEQEDSLRSSSPGEVEGLRSIPHVVALCNRLAGLVRERDPKAKVAPDSVRWLDAAEKLMRIDERPFEEAMAVLEWSQADPFWSAQILSMPNFRKHYPQLRAKWAIRRAGAAAAPQASVADLVAAYERPRSRTGIA